jgi:hypothetical protein
MDSAVVLKRTV